MATSPTSSSPLSTKSPFKTTTTTSNDAAATTDDDWDLQKTPVVSNRQSSQHQQQTMIRRDQLEHLSLPLTTTQEEEDEGLPAVAAAPVTDKLLGLLSSSSSSSDPLTGSSLSSQQQSPLPAHQGDSTNTTTTTTSLNQEEPTTTTSQLDVEEPSPPPPPPTPSPPHTDTAAPPSAYGTFFSGWWSSSSSSARTEEKGVTDSAVTTATTKNNTTTTTENRDVTNNNSNNNDDNGNEEEEVVVIHAQRTVLVESSQEQLKEDEEEEQRVTVVETAAALSNEKDDSATMIRPAPSDEMIDEDYILTPHSVPEENQPNDDIIKREGPITEAETAETTAVLDDATMTNGEEGQEEEPPPSETNGSKVQEEEEEGSTTRWGRKTMDETDEMALHDAFLESTETTTMMTTTMTETTTTIVEVPVEEPHPVDSVSSSPPDSASPSDEQEQPDTQLPPELQVDETSSDVTVPVSNVQGNRGEEVTLGLPPKALSSKSSSSMQSKARISSTTTMATSASLLPMAFRQSGGSQQQQQQYRAMRGLGQVHPDTPVHNADVCLRVLRKFARKTKSRIPTTYGGTKSLGLYGYFFAKKQDPTFVPYQLLMDILYETPEDPAASIMTTSHAEQHHHDEEMLQDDSETDHIVQGIMGETGDTMDRARRAIAAFVFVFSSWGHASAHEYAAHADSPSHTSKDAKTRESFSDLLAAVLNCASTLVAHGCLDHVVLLIGDADATEAIPVTHLLTESVLAADLNPERNELAAMKFVLSAGCRNVQPLQQHRQKSQQSDNQSQQQSSSSNNNVSNINHSAPATDALLGGSHLLQTVRMLYHIFLTTESTANKITARAALQQLVTHVFGRMVTADTAAVAAAAKNRTSSRMVMTPDGFPSEHHRNAFLILRAICKLSMRTLPDAASGMQAHVGFQSSGSNDTWDGLQLSSSSVYPFNHPDSAISSSSSHSHHSARDHHNNHNAQLIYTAAIHPALESKILALDLIHHVLTHTDFPPGFVQRSGPQFHSCLRNYLCVSLLKNCTSSETTVVNWSLRIFVPTVRNFRTVLKTEIEAFVTNVFFVILDSKHSTADHKGIVVRTFEEICSDPVTLAEIFLNYDCDLSAVDLFHRIVQTLSRVSRTGLVSESSDGNKAAAASLSLSSFVMGGSSSSAARMEKIRFETRELRLDAMKALRQVLASLHASMVEPMAAAKSKTASGSSSSMPKKKTTTDSEILGVLDPSATSPSQDISADDCNDNVAAEAVQNPVEVYGSKKKRRAEEAEAVLRFNQKPSAGLAFAAHCGHLTADDPAEVARYLWNLKNVLDKTMIGEYLGREAEYQNGFCIRVLHEYVRLLDFTGMVFDEAIRYFLSGFRLPGEAQKIDRIMEKFAERFTEQNPGLFPSADVAFILSFSIIMLNTDLHNPAIKEDRRMTKEGFIRNNRGICDGQDLPQELLMSIFDRIKENPISLKEDDDARERAGESSKNASRSTLQSAMNPASFFSSHYDEMDRARESNFRKERDHIVRTTESLLKRRRQSLHDGQSSTGKTPKSKSKSSSRSGQQQHHQRFVRTEDSGLRDEYVAPMFDVAWGPALAAFSTAMESANGTMGSLLAIATDEELEIAAENAAETIEVCLTGFRFAICTGGLCGNDTARDSFMLALSRFTQLGSGALLEPRHVRCCQTMLSLAREDGELLGTSWQHVFRALSEVNRFHQLFHLMARNDRAAAAAAERRRKRLEERDNRRQARERRKQRAQEPTDLDESGRSTDQQQQQGDWDLASSSEDISDVDSLAESDLFSDDDYYELEEDMDAKAIDEANARLIYEGISEDIIEVIYERSSSLSTPAIKEFVSQLCYVSSMEISVGYGSKDLNHVSYRNQHALLAGSSNHGGGHDGQFHHTQPNIYNLQKLVEVAHYNMESRPRLVFAEIWSTIANHLTQTALHKNPALAMYAVDSFRQLSIQFLQRDELEAFEFQRRFLKPLETVMAQSKQTSTKELLLNCVARVIQVFDVPAESQANTKGGLRSGWVPLLVILGLGARDDDINIAKMSHDILMSQIQQCSSNIKQSTTASVLLTEHFPETVDAVFMCVNGPHTDLSIQAIQVCSLLASYLADQDAETPHMKQRVIGAPLPGEGGDGTNTVSIPEATQDLELWWPLLLAISRTTGEDERSEELRLQALDTLFGIINDYFFSATGGSEDQIQRLQLAFRGILTPMLEFAEVGSGNRPPRLPKDFERFLTTPRVTITTPEDEAKEMDQPAGWLDAMFDRFVDACIALCKRTIEECKTKALVEEVFAILNHCLVSDSGSLAVRGVARLEQFVTSDLDPSLVSDDVWATVCHMLSRCLTVRGLPRKGSASSNAETGTGELDEEYEMEVREFKAEESILPDRRYVGSNAVMVIGNMLSSERISEAMGFRWRLFLINGLGKGIAAWEAAASLLEDQPQRQIRNGNAVQSPPDYRENAHYGRVWMNRFLLQLASMEQVVVGGAGSEGDEAKLYKTAQGLIMGETEDLLVRFVEAELALASSATKQNVALHKRLAKLAKALIKGYNNMRHEHILNMTWLNPTLLSSCNQSRDEEVIALIQKFVKSAEAKGVPEEANQPQFQDSQMVESAGENLGGGEGPIDVSAAQEALTMEEAVPVDESQSGIQADTIPEENQIDTTLEQPHEQSQGQAETPWDETSTPLSTEDSMLQPGSDEETTSALPPPPPTNAPAKPLSADI
ncbi:hypothetical protein ACA910_013180 [Epithemia clementina (nom. ined.)]